MISMNQTLWMNLFLINVQKELKRVFWSSIKFRVKQINSRTTKSLPDLFIPHEFEFFESLIDQERLEPNLFIYKNH